MDMSENSNKEQSSQQNEIGKKSSEFQNRWLPPLSPGQIPPSVPNNKVPQAPNPFWAGNYPPQVVPPPVYGSAPYVFSPAYPPNYTQNNPPAYFQKAYENNNYNNPPIGNTYGLQEMNMPPLQASALVYPSMSDTMNPLSVLCSRALTEDEYRKLQRNFGFFKGKTVIHLSILFLLFVFLNTAFALKNKNLLIVSIFIILSVTIFLISSIVFLVRRKQYIHNQYRLMQPFLQEERVIELYSDKIVEITDNRRLIIPYESVRFVYEIPEMIAIIDEYNQFIALRCEDMIPFDAQKTKEILYPRLQRAKKLFKGSLGAKLFEPLPIPKFRKKPEALISFPLEQSSKYDTTSIIKELLYQLPLLLSFGILLGTQLANTFWLTYSLLLDIFIFSGICFVFLSLILGVICIILYKSERRRFRNCKQLSGVAFTVNGAAICSLRETIEITWKRLKTIQKQDGLLLQFICEDRNITFYEIPWDYVPDREALLNLLQEHGSLS